MNVSEASAAPTAPGPSRLAVVALVVGLLLPGCSTDGPGAPDDPGPSPPGGTDSDPIAERLLPEGSYDVTYAACLACDPGVVPDYLAILAERLRGVVTISAADEYAATLRLVEMRRGDAGVDVLDLFVSPVVALRWNADTRVFDGRVPYGAAADFVPMFRRVGGGLACDFDVRHAKHDVGPTTCSVSPRPGR